MPNHYAFALGFNMNGEAEGPHLPMRSQFLRIFDEDPWYRGATAAPKVLRAGDSLTFKLYDLTPHADQDVELKGREFSIKTTLQEGQPLPTPLDPENAVGTPVHSFTQRTSETTLVLLSELGLGKYVRYSREEVPQYIDVKYPIDAKVFHYGVGHGKGQWQADPSDTIREYRMTITWDTGKPNKVFVCREVLNVIIPPPHEQTA